ncbi:MAG: hypothetical protein EPN48_17815 [Microbacteriaceae bacterium]|nr:MAG: hypothetical protein EPN48_17815 [Microbacteriaceae bacterium]
MTPAAASTREGLCLERPRGSAIPGDPGQPQPGQPQPGQPQPGHPQWGGTSRLSCASFDVFVSPQA